MKLLLLLFLYLFIAYSANIEDFWGVTQVTINGVTQETDNYGYANVRFDQKHTANSRFPIGSNTKLFTAVSIYQLQERGLLNVTDPIANYLNQTDFIKFGLPNVTHYCPHFVNSPNECVYLSFIHLLSMSSGIVAALDCPYNDTSVFKPYCWNFCSDTFIPYQGSIAYYVGTFIQAPLTFKPGTQYEYCNMGFIFAGYLIEKISGMNYAEYVQENIINVMDLKNTYYDPWDGQFGVNQYRVDEYILLKNAENPTEELGTGWCAPYMNLGEANSAGGMVSNNNDMHLWYTKLFNHSNGYIPAVFKYPDTINSIVYPYTFISNDSYYAQGIFVAYYNGTTNKTNDLWPDLISYTGGTLCSTTAIRMVPNNTELIATAFSNAPIALINHGETGLNELRYNTPYSTCQMAMNLTFLLLTNNPNLVVEQLLEKYMG